MYLGDLSRSMNLKRALESVLFEQGKVNTATNRSSMPRNPISSSVHRKDQHASGGQQPLPQCC